MRRWYTFILAFSLLVLFRPQAVPQSQPSSPPTAHSASNTGAKQDQTNCTNNGTYVNSKGKTVLRPETCSAVPKGVSAQCRDGSYSFSQSRRGACSHHGGVAKWLRS